MPSDKLTDEERIVEAAQARGYRDIWWAFITGKDLHSEIQRILFATAHREEGLEPPAWAVSDAKR